MKKIEINGKEYSLAGTWNEMSLEQLVFLAKLFAKGPCTVQDVKLKMLLFSLGARIRHYMRYDGDGYAVALPGNNCYMSTYQLMELGEVFSYLFRKTNHGYELDIKLTHNPLKVYTDAQLYGPDDALTDISYGQYVMLQSWHQRINSDAKALDNLLSVIWKKDSFSTLEEEHPELFAEIEQSIKMVMYWYYLGSIEFIISKFTRVFSSSGQGPEVGDAFDMQQRVIDEMAGGDVTKKEQVRSCMLYDALYTMETAIEREEKKKEKV